MTESGQKDDYFNDSISVRSCSSFKTKLKVSEPVMINQYNLKNSYTFEIDKKKKLKDNSKGKTYYIKEKVKMS